MKPLAISLALLLLAGAVPAQYVDEQGLRDHEEQDRRYLERLQQREAEPESAAVSEENLERLREELVARADRSIRDRNYRAATGARYRVQSDDPRLDAEAAVRLLEEFGEFFGSFWTGRLPLKPYETRSRAFLFYSFYKFNGLLTQDFRFRSARPKGHYGAAYDVILVHTDSGAPDGLADTLVHEAAHQLVEHRLMGGDRIAPTWVSEGLASYFGYTFRDGGGNFRPPVVGGKEVRLLRGVDVRWGAEPRLRLKRLRKTFRANRGEAGGLIEDVVSTLDPDRFYGEGAETRYAVSWVLVHFLLHGDDGAHAASFAGYLQRDDLDPENPRVLFDAIGMSAAELERAVAAHARTLDVH